MGSHMRSFPTEGLTDSEFVRIARQAMASGSGLTLAGQEDMLRRFELCLASQRETLHERDPRQLELPFNT